MKFPSVHSLLSSLPAFLALLLLGGLIGRGVYSADSIKSQYRVAARQAVANRDLPSAKFYYSRLVGDGDEGSPQDQLNMVSILDASGDPQAASELLARLAPDDSVGFAEAHRRKAAMFRAFIAKQKPNREVLEKYHWHLRHGARDASVESDLLWADYFLAIEKFDDAIGRLTSAAVREPDLWFQLIPLFQKMGRAEDANRAIVRAEKLAEDRLDSDPMNYQERLRLTKLLISKKQLDDAEKLLGEGFRLTGDEPEIKRAISNFALLKLSRLNGQTSGDIARERFVLLNEAMKYDPDNARVYDALSALYASVRAEEERASYRLQLQDWIASGISVPYAHFILGNLLWMEQKPDKAIFHLEQAFQLDSSLMIVANNLAWVLAHSETADLDRAERLVRTALEQTPDHPRYTDTLAAVLFQQQRYQESLVEYEKVLSKMAGVKRRDTHKRLATIYEQLNQPEIADSHRQQAAKVQLQ